MSSTNTTATATALAEVILKTHAGPKPIVLQPTSSLIPADVHSAFLVQRQTTNQRIPILGAIGGYKVGWGRALGHDGAVGGAVHASRIFASGAKLPRSEFSKVGVEVEVLARLSRTIPISAARTLTTDTIAPYLASFAPAIELIDDRYPSKRDIKVMVADSFLAWGLVLGKETPAQDVLPHITNLKTDCYIDGNLVAEGNSKNVSGNPLVHLVAIAKVFADLGVELEAGQVVSMGSTIVPWWPPKDVSGGFRIRGSVEKLGTVECEIVGSAAGVAPKL